MKIFEVKNIWANGKITKQSLVSKLAYKELELKEGETAQVEFDDDDKAERFVKYAKSIGLSVKEVSNDNNKKQDEQKAEKNEVKEEKQDEQKKEQPVEEQQVEDKQEEQKTSSNKKNKK